MGAPGIIMIIVAAAIAIPLLIVAIIYLVVPLFRAIGWVIGKIARFIGGEVSDVLGFFGAALTALLLIPLVIGNIIIGRWSATAHFGRAIQAELGALCKCVYRVVIGHPARLFCLNTALDGIERRIPEAIAAAPGADKPRGRAHQFAGYGIVGSLPGGGSGGRLYVAEPDESKLAAFARRGIRGVEQVVVKCFSLSDGSTLPQIVRESQALSAGRKLGLILDHELTDERFYYVMRYVPGESLGLVTPRLHASSGAGGLDDRGLHEAMGYAGDLLATLTHYHAGGLWHKDVKPDNIIVEGGRAHLVDFGLITPLRSNMTLTTHGTEYFRDPEMVRMALKGVKVHQVDGARFDVYAAGAVLYSMIENSFPAHGGLSQITKRCPDALRWIVRRAMTDYDKRYHSAQVMLDDLRFVMAAREPLGVRPADLPSMAGADAPEIIAGADRYDDAEPSPGFAFPEPPAAGPAQVAPAAAQPARAAPAAPRPRSAPAIVITDWWRGRYQAEGPAAVRQGPAAVASPVRHSPAPRRATGKSASQQLEDARARARAARARAHQRSRSRRGQRNHAAGVNGGVAAALIGFLAVAVLLGGGIVAASLWRGDPRFGGTAVVADAPSPAQPTANVLLPTADGEAALFIMREPVAHTGENADLVGLHLARLRAAGFTLVGDLPVESGETELTPEMLGRIASLRTVVGTRTVPSAEAASVVRRWLDEDDQNRQGAVLWITRRDGGDRIVPWVIIRPGHESLGGVVRDVLNQPIPVR